MTVRSFAHDHEGPLNATSAGWMLFLALLMSVLPIGVGTGSSEGSAFRQFALTAIFTWSLWLIISRYQAAARILSGIDFRLYALFIYVGLTVVWSPAPEISAKRYIQLIGIMLIALAVSIQEPGRINIFAKSTLAATGLSIVLSCLYIAFVPSKGIAEEGWRGFYGSKNTFGQLLAIYIIFYISCRKLLGRRQNIAAGLVAGFSVILLLLSRSTTSCLVLAIIIVTLFLSQAGARARASTWAPVILIAAMLSLFGALMAYIVSGPLRLDDLVQMLFGAMGKDASLTGRTYLWELMIQEARENLIFGRGYGGFWLGLSGPSGEIAAKVGWGYPGQAHNGYLDVLNEIGICGLTILLIMLASYFFKLRRNNMIGWTGRRVALCLLSGFLVFNLTESSFLRNTSFIWILVCVILVQISVKLRMQSEEVIPSKYSGTALKRRA